MKELTPGVTANLEITVTDEMRPAFDGEVVHQVMSTVTMIYYMEKAGRHVILPYLEEGEEGAGYDVSITHTGPAIVGEKVVFTAVCTQVTERRVVCEVTARTSHGVIGQGTFTQAIFRKARMEKKLQELREALEL